MFGFEINSDLLIFAIIAQTIGISLIILTIYCRIIKIHYKNIALDEKIDEKLDRIESKLSYLSNQVLIISAKEDKIKYQTSPLDPSTYTPTRVTPHGNLESQGLIKDIALYAQNSKDSKIIESMPTAAAAAAAATSSLTPHDNSFSIKSNNDNNTNNNTNNNKSTDDDDGDNDTTAIKDSVSEFIHNRDGPTSTKSFYQDGHIIKNTNPEIDKIEKEILTALKRLGGNGDDYGDLNDYDKASSKKEDILYPAVKKSDSKVKNFD